MSIKKTLYTLLAAVLLLLFAVSAHAAMAPLSPEFLKWREEQKRSVHASGVTSSNRDYGIRPSPLNLSHLASNPVKAAADIPESFDLRTLGVIPPIRSQASWGTCWAFATTAAIEIGYLMQLRNGTMSAIPAIGSTPEEVDLSEMHVAWFTFMAPKLEQRFTNASAKNFRKPTGYSALSEGAYADVPVAFMARGYGWGPVLEKDMPYISKYISDDEIYKGVGKQLPGETSEQYNDRWEKETERLTDPWCAENLTGKKPSDYTPVLRMKEAAYVVAMKGSSDEDNGRMFQEENLNSIKQLVMEKGALYISYPAGGIVSNESYCYTSTDKVHAVALIGWDDNYPVSKFVQSDDKGNVIPKTPGAWLVRNSWGTEASGHNGGYFWLSYEQQNMGTGTAFTMANADSSLTTYTHSDLGWCNSYGDGQTNSPFYGASVFKVGTNSVILREIGFYTTDNNATAEFSIYKYGTTKPSAETLTSGQPAATVSSRTIDYAGYHSVELGSNVTVGAGEYFAVVQKSTNPSNGYPLAVMMKIDNWSDWAQFYDGEGYISTNGTDWDDGVTMSDDKGNPTPVTPCIYVSVSNAAAGDDGEDSENLTIDGVQLDDYVSYVRDINVDPDYNTALNPETERTGRRLTLTLSDPNGNPVPDNQQFVFYLMYTNDILHWVDEDTTSEWGVRYPSGDIVAFYPHGYKPDMFLELGIEDDFGNLLSADLPVYGPFEAVTSSGGKISLDVDNLVYADIGDVDKAGEKAKIPTGYHDLCYYAEEDTTNAASGIVADLDLTVYASGGGDDDGSDGVVRVGKSSSGCDAGLGGCLALCLAGLAVFCRKN